MGTDDSAPKTVKVNRCFAHFSPPKTPKGHQRYSSTVDPASQLVQDDQELRFEDDLEIKQSARDSRSDIESSPEAETPSETAQSSNDVEDAKQELENAEQVISHLKRQLTDKDQRIRHRRHSTAAQIVSQLLQLQWRTEKLEDDEELDEELHELSDDDESKQSARDSRSDTGAYSEADTRSETALSSNDVEYMKQELESAKQEISQLKHQLKNKDRRIEELHREREQLSARIQRLRGAGSSSRQQRLQTINQAEAALQRLRSALADRE